MERSIRTNSMEDLSTTAINRFSIPKLDLFPFLYSRITKRQAKMVERERITQRENSKG